MVTCIIVFSKKRQIPCQELFEFFYKKTPAANLITANRPEGEDCGEWLQLKKYKYKVSSHENSSLNYISLNMIC